MTQDSLFPRDLPSGVEGKNKGMDRALWSAPDDWRAAFEEEALQLARIRRPFTSEDITARVGLPAGGIGTNRNNAVGAMMNGLARRGLIRKTGRRVKSRAPSSHAAELIEWVGA